MLKILSWNVNGIRAAHKKGFLIWLQKEFPDILCLQEIKATQAQLPKELLYAPGYQTYWNPALRLGYSGVAVYTKEKPVSVKHGLGVTRFDEEGRVLQIEYKNFTLLNIYFPNGKMNEERLRFKLDFYNQSLELFQKLKKEGRKLVICGDYNTAHKPIDLAHPKENEDTSGFLPIEREWLNKLIASGFVDTFRELHPEPG